MLVNIDEIQAGGLATTWEIRREQVDEMLQGDKAGYRAAALACAEARLTKLERRVIVEAHSRVEVSCPCGRCLAPTSQVIPVDFTLTLVPSDEYDEAPRKAKDPGRGQAGGSFETGKVDEETYKGKVFDLDPIFREQLLLALPAYPVCREGCKGLCPTCGANLNDRACGCDPHVPDPRWAGLKKVKLQ